MGRIGIPKTRDEKRVRRHLRVRKNVTGTPERPRLRSRSDDVVVVVGHARRCPGTFGGVLVQVVQPDLGRSQFRLDLAAQVIGFFTRLLGRLFQQGFRFGQHVGKILDEGFAAAFEFCCSHGHLQAKSASAAIGATLQCAARQVL